MTANKVRKTEFGKISKLYDDARQDYPKELVRDVLNISHANKGRIIEVGCGSGIATEQFAAKDREIVAIDISNDLIKIAKNKLKYCDIRFIVAPFEKAKVSGKFDLLVSAQAFHWINPKIGYKKAHAILKENGYIAIFWNSYFGHDGKYSKKVRLLFQKHIFGEKNFKLNERMNSYKKNIRDSGLFNAPKIKVYSRTKTFTKEEYVQLINSMSFVSAMQESYKKEFFKDVDKILPKRFKVEIKTFLLIAKAK